MINHIKGNITYKSPTFIVVETNGVGYHINISLNTYTQIEKLETVKILTLLQIKEDAHTLYGFAEEVERNLFKHLISVSGVGPSIAQLVLSGMQPDEVRAAIIGDNDLAFSKVKGIGPKTAKRIILDLKDKLVKDSGEEILALSPSNNTMREEALSALLALGFQKILAQKALNKLLKERTDLKTVEALIKAALKELS
ncbi:MAG: Holliday junction branch migration protein RuvA [Saprospiraceae bacterium]|nr:Holliday junction branch migration protein RuvA [Saprospiraceae bacterium]